MTDINVRIEEPEAINIQIIEAEAINVIIAEGEAIKVNISEGVASVLANIFTALEEGKQITKLYITDDRKVAIEFKND